MKSDYQFNVIAKIRKIRESKGISQTRMAEFLGISPGQIGNIESYDMPHKYTLKQLVNVCGVLNIGMEDIFTTNDTGQAMSLNTFINCLIKYQER